MKEYIFNIFKIIILYNAALNGYRIKKLSNNSFELKIKDDKCNNYDLKKFIDELVSDNTDLKTLKKNYNTLLEISKKKNNIDL